MGYLNREKRESILYKDECYQIQGAVFDVSSSISKLLKSSWLGIRINMKKIDEKNELGLIFA